MTLIVCVDPRGGISFNGRRQTRDRAIMADILAGREINIFPGSEKYVRSVAEGIVGITEINVLEDGALPNDGIVFVERGATEFFERCLDLADEVIVYQWENTYLYTQQFPDVGKRPDFIVSSVSVLQGSTHPNVTKTTYIKNNPLGRWEKGE